MNRQSIESIVQRHQNQQGSLMAILTEVQSTFGYLPQEALQIVSEKTGRSLVDIYGVATFYRSFSLEPRGKHVCSVCVGTACHVRGSEAIGKDFEQQLGVGAGETTADREFSLEKVACLGACALGPIVTVDGHYFSNVKRGQVKKILDQAREGLDKVDVQTDPRVFPVEVSCPRCNHDLMDPHRPVDGRPSIGLAFSFDHKQGRAWLSCLYGSHDSESEPQIPPDTIVNVFCPHCHARLHGAARCGLCGSEMFPMIVRPVGMAHVCVRRGCKGHMLDLDGANT